MGVTQPTNIRQPLQPNIIVHLQLKTLHHTSYTVASLSIYFKTHTRTYRFLTAIMAMDKSPQLVNLTLSPDVPDDPFEENSEASVPGPYDGNSILDDEDEIDPRLCSECRRLFRHWYLRHEWSESSHDRSHHCILDLEECSRSSRCPICCLLFQSLDNEKIRKIKRYGLYRKSVVTCDLYWLAKEKFYLDLQFRMLKGSNGDEHYDAIEEVEDYEVAHAKVDVQLCNCMSQNKVSCHLY